MWKCKKHSTEQWVKKEIKGKLENILANANENTTYQN